MIKRRLGYLAIATGLILSLWVGSYTVFRQTTEPSLWDKIMIDDIVSARVVSIPKWMEPVKVVYRPLASIDQSLMGRRVHIGKSRSIHIGATADF